MKTDIHPEYGEATITCACGNIIHTRSTKAALRIEICSKCHPYFTGKQKIVDTAGRVERFERKYGEVAEELERKQEEERRVRIETAKERAERQVAEREERKARLADRQRRKAERAAAHQGPDEAAAQAVVEPAAPPAAEGPAPEEGQAPEPEAGELEAPEPETHEPS
ncbi:MAG: 50S ribosomal protein L31 [Candidatus Tectimicrobiota bacterium]